MREGAPAEPGPGLAGSEAHDELLGWALLLVPVLAMTGAGMLHLVPGFLSMLDASDARDWWRTSASHVAVGGGWLVLALTSLITVVLVWRRSRKR